MDSFHVKPLRSGCPSMALVSDEAVGGRLQEFLYDKIVTALPTPSSPRGRTRAEAFAWSNGMGRERVSG